MEDLENLLRLHLSFGSRDMKGDEGEEDQAQDEQDLHRVHDVSDHSVIDSCSEFDRWVDDENNFGERAPGQPQVRILYSLCNPPGLSNSSFRTIAIANI